MPPSLHSVKEGGRPLPQIQTGKNNHSTSQGKKGGNRNKRKGRGGKEIEGKGREVKTKRGKGSGGKRRGRIKTWDL